MKCEWSYPMSSEWQGYLFLVLRFQSCFEIIKSIWLIVFSPGKIYVTGLIGFWLKTVFLMTISCSAQECRNLNLLPFDYSTIYCLTTSNMNSEYVSPTLALKSRKTMILNIWLMRSIFCWRVSLKSFTVTSYPECEPQKLQFHLLGC